MQSYCCTARDLCGDMLTNCESVRFWGKTGSRRLAVKVRRLRPKPDMA